MNNHVHKLLFVKTNIREVFSMSFYEKYQSACDEQDIGAMLQLFHPDYERIFLTFSYITSIHFPLGFLNRYV